ncbi:MAG: hypothetical protein K9I84_15775 [Leadbetterella sp.]|nr:hypothetical protein [Leadbetterella sp.]
MKNFSILSLNLNIKKISTHGKMQWFLLKAQNNKKTTAIFASIYELCARLTDTLQIITDKWNDNA